MIKLRDYQLESVDEIREALAKYRSVLFQLVTGGGKTITFSYIASCSSKLGRKVLVMSNRTEILNQNGGALEKAGLDVDYISPKTRNIPTKNVAVCMSQTLRRRLEKEEWVAYIKTIDLLIVDEAHCCDHDFVYNYISPKCYRLLVTATPSRQGKQRQLGELVNAMVLGIKTKDLIKRGYICPARHFAVAAPKLDNVEIDSSTREYNQKSLSAVYEQKPVYEGVIDEWMRLCGDKKTLMFCVSSTQAIECTKELIKRGIEAKYVLSGSFEDDSTYSGERKELFNDFRDGKFQVLVNVGIAVAGTDIPDLECIVANFATTSMSKWRQAIGRGCRIAEGKECFYILDAGDNIKRLGFFDTDIEWSLWHDVSSGGGLQPMKECPTDKIDVEHKKGCGARVPMTCKICPSCGFKFHTEKDLIQLHLEEVSNSDEKDLSSWVASKRLAGWSMPRILINVCISNPDNMRQAFMESYLTISPGKTIQDARKFYYVFMKQYGDKIKIRAKNTSVSFKQEKPSED